MGQMSGDATITIVLTKERLQDLARAGILVECADGKFIIPTGVEIAVEFQKRLTEVFERYG